MSGADHGYAPEWSAATSLEALRLVLLLAPHFQGGHSEKGAAIADFLGIAFPLKMHALHDVARKHGFDPAVLWPWSTAP